MRALRFFWHAHEGMRSHAKALLGRKMRADMAKGRMPSFF
jgi:hypothetical protein